MKIVLINQFYPPDTAPTGQLLADVAKSLAGQDHEVHVICSKGAYSGGDLAETDLATRNLAVHRVHASKWGRGRLLGRAIDYASFYIMAFLKIQCMPHMDVCLALTTPPFIGLIGSFMKKKRKTRFVLWSMDVYPEIAISLGILKEGGFLHKVTKKMSKNLYSRADKIISLGEVMTQKLTEAGASSEKIATIHNWVPREIIKPLEAGSYNKFKKEWGLENKTVFMYSGNMGMGHELEMLYEAIMHLEDTNSLRLIFVGKGRMRSQLEALKENLNLDCVDFHDPVPLRDLSLSIAVGDVHIVSQKPGTEGLIVPSKIYGILAAGKPVIFIGSQGCEVAKIINESNSGIIVNPSDTNALAEAFNTLCSNSSKRETMGRNARDYYDKNFGRHQGVPVISKLLLVKEKCN